MRSVTLLTFVLSAVVTPAFAQGNVGTLPPDDRRYAFLIGVSDYDDEDHISSFKNRAPDNDVTRLRDVLIANAGFLSENVFLLSSGSPEPSKKPTRPNILKILNRLENEVPSDGLFLFFFSGHGITVESKPFLLPSDAVFFPSAKKMADVSLSLETIKDSIEEMKVSQVIVLMDACRNDPRNVAKGDTPNIMTAAFKGGLDLSSLRRPISAYATFFATKEGYRAYIDTNTRQGFFAAAIVEALQGTGNPESVTLQSLIEHVQDSVPDRVKRQHGDDAIQEPDAEVRGYLAGKLELARPQMEVQVTMNPRRAALSIEGAFELAPPVSASPQLFLQRGASLNVGCEETVGGSVEFRLPSTDAEFDRSSIEAQWVDANNIKSMSANFQIEGDRVIALGTITGRDRQEMLVARNCPGGGHATLQVSGSYRGTATSSEPQTVGFNPSPLQDSLYVRIPRRAGLVVKSVTLRALDEGGESIDRLKLALDTKEKSTTVLSERGRFLAATSGPDVITLLPASRLLIADEPHPTRNVSPSAVTDASRTRIKSTTGPVGELRILDSARREIRCVGFLVAQDLVATSAHCVAGFSQGQIVLGAPDSSRAFPVSVRKLNAEADLALLDVTGRPGGTFGIARLAKELPAMGSPVTLVQAERAQSQCNILEVNGSRLVHSCNGGAGSAGSPLMLDDGTVIGMHVQRGLRGDSIAVGAIALASFASR